MKIMKYSLLRRYVSVDCGIATKHLKRYENTFIVNSDRVACVKPRNEYFSLMPAILFVRSFFLSLRFVLPRVTVHLVLFLLIVLLVYVYLSLSLSPRASRVALRA